MISVNICVSGRLVSPRLLVHSPDVCERLVLLIHVTAQLHACTKSFSDLHVHIATEVPSVIVE